MKSRIMVCVSILLIALAISIVPSKTSAREEDENFLIVGTKDGTFLVDQNNGGTWRYSTSGVMDKRSYAGVWLPIAK